MGAIISPSRKRAVFPFLKENLGKISQRKIAKKLGIGKTTINRWSLELGFRHPHHSVNESFFDTWNEHSSYILGYIFADGNVAWNPKKGYQSLTITAAEKDSLHLERIRKLLSSTKPLLYSEKTKSYRLIANSKKLCQKLIKLGVVPCKSLIVRFPTHPGIQLRHFIRGAIDGDGTVTYFKRKRSPYFRILVASGSFRFLKKMKNAIKKNIGVESLIRKASKNTFVIQYSCTKGRMVGDWIYRDCNLFLERKFQPYVVALTNAGGGQP